MRAFPTALQPTTKCQSDTKSQPKEKEMHEIIAKLHVAYTLIHKGMEEEDMLLVEEGFGYLAEAKAMLEGE